MGEKVYRSADEFRRLALVHRWNAIGVGILLLSGLLLYAEPLRGALAPVRVPLKYLHIGAGLVLAVYAFSTAAQWGSFLTRRGLHLGRRLNTVLTLLWLLAWTLTGLAMWLNGAVSFEVRNAATGLHDWLTWLAIPWLLLHVAFRLFKVRRLDERIEIAAWLGAPATRRGFLYAGAAAIGLWIMGGWFRSGGGLAPVDSGVDKSTLPGGGMKGRFRLYFVNDVIPTFRPDTWRLQVGSKSYTWDDFLALPQTELVCNFHCVTGWSVFNISWVGVRLVDLLQDAGMTEPVPALIFHSGDGEYTDSLTWEQATHPDVMLAHTMEGAPLPQLQGGPLRLVTPLMYGYKSVKWVERITVTDNPGYRGYWQERGYPVDAYLEKNEPVKGGDPDEWNRPSL